MPLHTIIIICILGGRPNMTSDGGREGSAKSDFIMKGSLIKYLKRGEGGSKKGKNHLTSYVYGQPLEILLLRYIMKEPSFKYFIGYPKFLFLHLWCRHFFQTLKS